MSVILWAGSSDCLRPCPRGKFAPLQVKLFFLTNIVKSVQTLQKPENLASKSLPGSVPWNWPLSAALLVLSLLRTDFHPGVMILVHLAPRNWCSPELSFWALT